MYILFAITGVVIITLFLHLKHVVWDKPHAEILKLNNVILVMMNTESLPKFTICRLISNMIQQKLRTTANFMH